MKLLHVAFGFEGKPIEIEKLKEIFDNANGWARYAPNCWVIHTDEAPPVWAERFRAICSKDDSIFVVEINKQNRGGYLEKEIWDWLGKTG